MNGLFVWLLGLGALALGLVLFLVLTLASEVGFQLGRRRGAPRDGEDHTVTATLTSGMVGLLAFILGLTINFSQNRYEARRDLVVEEANAIGTAWQRARMIGGADGEAIAQGIHRYARLRLAFTEGSAADAHASAAPSEQEKAEIWAREAAIAHATPTPIVATLITALNEMFDDAQAQRFAFLDTAPVVMLEMLLFGAILAIGAMGYESGSRGARQPLLTSLLLVMWAGGMVVTVDLSRPRLGLIQVDSRPLVWTIEEMDHAPPPPPVVQP